MSPNIKNFLNLLGTDLELTVSVNHVSYQAGLLAPLVFDAGDIVTVDGIEVLPKFVSLSQGGKLYIDEPFYCWYHQVSGQGWLLKPQ